MNTRQIAPSLALATLLAAVPITARTQAATPAAAVAPDYAQVSYQTVTIDGVKIFYREAGDPTRPTILLLHGFPSSSHMFRDLIPKLADRYHLVAPDYPGFGNSGVPDVTQFQYTFDHLADIVDDFTQKLGLTKYSLYVQDYGAPVGFRLAARHPERVQAIITQNGNAYEEGLTSFWGVFRDSYWKDPSAKNAQPLLDFLKPAGTQLQYFTGVRDKSHISPDAWELDQRDLDRPGNADIQLALFYDYRKNLPLYDQWHAYFRKYQPPTLVVWGKNDPVFGPAGATAFQKDLPHAEVHLLDTGHFALEEDSAAIAAYIRAFLAKELSPSI